LLILMVSAFLVAFAGGDDSARHDAQLLLDTIDALQQTVEDFRCEFEGSVRFQGKVAEAMKVGEDGVYNSYSGVFIWRKGGDIHIENWQRQASQNQIMRESIVVRMAQGQAEQYSRSNDAPLGYAAIKSPKDVKTWFWGMGMIFLVDRMKREVADPTFDPSVSDDEIDGRPLKVLNIALTGVPGSLMYRYWIDMRRSGQVVRQEDYTAGKIMIRRLDIKLAAFKVGNDEVWMPVAGDAVGYSALVDKKPVVMKEPQAFEKISVVGGTMAFNKHLGPDAFTIKYKPGTPVSDSLRRLEYEYGQQSIGTNPTKPEVESKLKELLAKAEEQKSQLVVASVSEGFPLWTWLAWGFGALVLISCVTLWIQGGRADGDETAGEVGSAIGVAHERFAASGKMASRCGTAGLHGPVPRSDAGCRLVRRRPGGANEVRLRRERPVHTAAPRRTPRQV
jgi:hypothetical protein